MIFTYDSSANFIFKFEAAQDTNMLANSTVEEQVHYTTSTPLNKGSQNSAGRSNRPRYTPQQTLL